MKRCSKCGEPKEFSEFCSNRSRKDGKTDQCKSCLKLYRLENKDEVAKRQRKYKLENKERLAEYRRKYQLENKERLAEYHRKYQLENKERAVKYELENKEKRTKYQLENADKIAKRRLESRKTLSPVYVVKCLRIPSSQLTPELLELKRAQLEIFRLTKQLKKEIQNGN